MVIASLYLATVFLDGTGTGLPAKWLPRPWVYFAQVSALFPFAAVTTIDYRAEGWSCAERKWVEIDVRPFFPIDADNKENRFYRAVQFYRRDRAVMRALEGFVVTKWNGADRPRIGGVRFLSLRIPIPPAGAHLTPHERQPVSSYPRDQRHDWYWTPKSKRLEACGVHVDKKDDNEDEAPSLLGPGPGPDHDEGHP